MSETTRGAALWMAQFRIDRLVEPPHDLMLTTAEIGQLLDHRNAQTTLSVLHRWKIRSNHKRGPAKLWMAIDVWERMTGRNRSAEELGRVRLDQAEQVVVVNPEEVPPGPPLFDWRGTPITVGAVVLYRLAGPQIWVEAVVERATANWRGWIMVRPVRRSRTNATHATVQDWAELKPESVTVVTGFPDSSQPTEQQMAGVGRTIAEERRNAQTLRRRVERARRRLG